MTEPTIEARMTALDFRNLLAIMNGGTHRERMLRGLYLATDPQPWRCTVCREAISYIRRNDCRCIREARARQAGVEAPSGSPA
jgi:hypothetical protein